MHQENFLTGFLLFFSKLVIYLTGLSIIVSGVVFLAGGSLVNNLEIFLTVVLLTALLLFWEFRKYYSANVSRIAVYLALSAATFMLATIIVTRIYDKSWDGMAYHQIAIIELSEGWNPVYESLPMEEQDSKYFDRKIILNRWVNHYGKGLEVFATVMMGVSGSIESGKVFNGLLMAAAFCTALYLLFHFRKISRLWALVLAFAAAFNPIAVNQLFSYYLDGAIGSLLLILACVFILLYMEGAGKKSVPSLIIVFFVVILLINLKFTGLVYAGLLGVTFAGFLFWQKSFGLLKVFLATSVLSGIIAVAVAGFNPYITNTFQHGHPFHPLAGKNKVDIISINIPEPMKESNALQKFVSSTFSRSENFDNRNPGEQMKYKIPFTFNNKELKAFQSEGIRLGGFGVFWSGIFLLSLLLGAIAFISVNGKERLYLLFIIAAIFIPVAINPESWWARYVPQLWLFPPTVCFFLIHSGRIAWASHASRALLVLLVLNSLLVCVVYTASAVKTTMNANIQFARLKKSSGPNHVYFDIFTPNEKKFQDRQIPYLKVNKVSELPCDNPAQVMKIEFCPPAK